MNNLKKIAAGAMMAGALGAGALVGASPASADDPWLPWPFDPDDIEFPIEGPPGHIGVPPGQLKKVLPPPFTNCPPGHWDDLQHWKCVTLP